MGAGAVKGYKEYYPTLMGAGGGLRALQSFMAIDLPEPPAIPDLEIPDPTLDTSPADATMSRLAAQRRSLELRRRGRRSLRLDFGPSPGLASMASIGLRVP